MAKKEKYLVSPDINNKSLITKLNGFDEKGNKIISKVINEKALTIFLNNQEIVTLMSISDHPKYLAVGYLLNQNMLKKNDIISKVETLTPSLYLETGAIHGCAIIHNNKPLIYMEDVGRHNAVDKIAGFMFLKKISSSNKIFYTTGRLTSEMVIKTIKMGIPILISRSGFTAWGVELARGSNLTLIGRAKGKKYLALSGEHRIDHK